METSKQIETEILRVHNLFWESYASRDIDLRFSLCSDDVTFIGSGLHERAKNKEEYKKINEDGVKQFPDPFQIEFVWTNLSMLNENVACVESEVIWSQLINNKMSKELLRNTTLLKNSNNNWVVTHVHGSVPDYRLKDGDYMTNEQTIIRNKELERQVFERTQELNDTLKELEQKNHELEIESALEKVRTIAMGMRKPADMLDVCKIISVQFQSLGVKEIRNVQTAIFYEQRGTYMNYEFYAKHDKTIITETVFTNHEIHNEFATKMLKGKGEAFITHIIGDEVEEWIAYQKTTNVFIDKYLETASSLNYYWFSLGPVALGISTYHPLSENEMNLFKRFLRVFELAYQRYLDIEKAEAQAREAQIEAALERVRGYAMAMHNSSDLSATASIIFTELKKLGINPIRSGVGLIIKDELKAQIYSATASGEKELSLLGTVTFSGHTVFKEQYEHWLKKKNYFAALSGKELTSYYRQLSEGLNTELQTKFENEKEEFGHWIMFSEGFLYAWSDKKYSEPELNILDRFKNVIELTFKRYFDLKKAEAQAREAQIEAALERVRSKAMAMNSSEDLAITVDAFFSELNKLDINPHRCGVGIVDKKTRIADIRATAHTKENISKKIVGKLKLAGHPVLDKVFENWKLQHEYHPVLRGNEISEYYKIMNPQVEFPDFAEDEVQYGYYFQFKEGGVFAWTDKELKEEDVQIFRRYTSVLSLTYRRYIELKEAEAQAREAQIELSLERVRARTMAMQKSEELKEVIRVVYEQFIHLKINVDHAGFVVDYTPKGDWHFWIADQQEIPSKITHPYFESVWAHQFNEAKEKGIDYFTTNLNFEEKNKFYNELLSYVPGLPEASKDFYLSCPGLATTTVLMDDVGLYIENFSGTPYSDEENAVLMRFGKVFQQTYTRFLDLQKAEAQAREAQVQLALERVRARSLAMHHTSELQEVVNILAQQLYNMNIDINGGVFIVINDEVDKDIPLWASGGAADYVQKATVPFLNKPVLSLLRDAIRRKNNFFTEEHSWEEKIGLFEHLFKYPPWNSLSLQRRQELLSREGGYTRSVTVSNHTSISITNHNGKKFSDGDNEILKRFGNVFEQSYIRFLDLQKAEVQTREARIEASLEKVRAAAMSMHKPADLLDVSETLFRELLLLGFDEIRNAMINIHNDDNKTFLNYDYSNEIGKSVTLLDYYAHPVMEKQINQARIANDAFSEAVYKGEDLEAWKDFRKKYGEKDDPRIKNITALYYYFYSIGNGTIGISTFSPINHEKLALLKRFRNVFSLAYQRYSDMALAEAQAREAQIEAALERVRSRTMAMRKSDELAETVSVLFKQLLDLGVKSTQLRTCGIVTFKENEPKGEVWITDITGEIIDEAFIAPYNEAPAYKMIYSEWKKGEKFLEINLKGDAFIEHLNFIKKYSDVPNINLDEIQKMYSEIFFHVLFFSQGYLFIISYEPLPEYHEIFKRFGALFQQTYTRFLDFKKVEAQTKIIQAENDRKTKELEEARQLQLSLLPKTVPRLPHLEIAVYMKTATEVGGDYYDFNVQENGVLNLGFGDATGHGLQAGTMITLMKGFFTSDAARFGPQKFLEHCNSIIRDIKLGRILMSFSHLRFENNRLMISSAGMPPVYYYHKKNNRTEEIIIQGLPLGAMQSSSYKIVEKVLNGGDTILLLTDGLPEQMNSNKVIFDYSRVLKYFGEIAENTADDIIKSLVEKADEWMNGTPQADDITFLVIRVK